MKKLGIIIVFLFLGNTGCVDIGESDQFPKMAINLKNLSDEYTHMWITGETIGPDNKIYPGYHRNAVYYKSADLMDKKIKEEYITIYAGRNGIVLTQTYELSIFPNSYRIIGTFDGETISAAFQFK